MFQCNGTKYPPHKLIKDESDKRYSAGLNSMVQGMLQKLTAGTDAGPSSPTVQFLNHYVLGKQGSAPAWPPEGMQSLCIRFHAIAPCLLLDLLSFDPSGCNTSIVIHPVPASIR